MAKSMAQNPPRQDQGQDRVSQSNVTGGQGGQSRELDLLNDVTRYLKDYARERPEVAAMWCFGIGFVVGWRLKPW